MGVVLFVATIVLLYILNPNGLFLQGNLRSIPKPASTSKAPAIVTNPKLPTPPAILEKVIPKVEPAKQNAKTHLEIGADGKVHFIDNETGNEVDTNPYNENVAEYIPCQKGIIENGKTVWSYCNGADFLTGFTKIFNSTHTFTGKIGDTDHEKFNVIQENPSITENTGFFDKLTQNIQNSTQGSDGRKYFQGMAYSRYSDTPEQVQFTVIPDPLDKVDGTHGFTKLLIIGSVGEGVIGGSESGVYGSGNINYGLDFLNGLRKIEFNLKNNSIMRFENFTGFDFSRVGEPVAVGYQGAGTVTPIND